MLGFINIFSTLQSNFQSLKLEVLAENIFMIAKVFQDQSPLGDRLVVFCNLIMGVNIVDPTFSIEVKRLVFPELTFVFLEQGDKGPNQSPTKNICDVVNLGNRVISVKFDVLLENAPGEIEGFAEGSMS